MLRHLDETFWRQKNEWFLFREPENDADDVETDYFYFMNAIRARDECYKTFYGRNLLLIVIS